MAFGDTLRQNLGLPQTNSPNRRFGDTLAENLGVNPRKYAPQIDLSYLDPDALELTKQKYEASWKDNYNVLDRADYERQTGSKMPTALEGKYEDTEVDRYLYAQGLPPSKAFNKLYAEALTEAQKKREGQYNSLVTVQNRMNAEMQRRGLDSPVREEVSDIDEQINALQTRLDAANQIKANRSAEVAPYWQGGGETQGYNVATDITATLGAQIDALKQQKRMYAQAVSPFNAVSQNPDFEQMSAQGAAIANQPDNIRNKVAYARDNYERLVSQVDTRDRNAAEAGELLLTTHMTEEEVSNYNYILAKHGDEGANNYLDFLNDTLRQRAGGQMADNIMAAPAPVRAVVGGMQAVGGGMEQAATGLRQLASEEALPISTTQYTSQALRSQLTGVGGVAFDVGQAVGNMLPSIAVGGVAGALGAPAAIASAIGSATLGASSGGNAYAEALRQGYTVEQARAYGILTGASEGALQYALGGISKLGGVASQAITGKIGNAIARVVSNPTAVKILSGAGKIASSMGSEFTEEYLQEILSPVIRNITLDEHNEVKPFTEEALYAGILGAITGGVFEGADVALNGTQTPTAEAPTVETTDEIPIAQPVRIVETNNVANAIRQESGEVRASSVSETTQETEYDAIAQELVRSSRLNPFDSPYLKQPAQALDKMAKNNPKLRQQLYAKIEQPLYEAGGNFGRRTDAMFQRVAQIAETNGIKVGSKESAAVQRIGEGQYQTPDGIKPYTIADLQAEFPDNWQNIQATAQEFRAIYDNYIDELNTMLEGIYPNVVKNAQFELENHQAALENLVQKQSNFSEQAARLEQKIADTQAELDGKGRTDTKTYPVLQNRIVDLNSRLEKARANAASYDARIAAQQAKIAQEQSDIDSGEILRNKQIPKRQDYFHHFRELASGIEGLKNIFSVSHEIAPELVGVSDFTKPKTKWEGFLQRRFNGAYKEDAVGGLLRYIPAAEYKLAFDPVTEKIRAEADLIKSAAARTDSRNANQTIHWLDNMANSLSGKTNFIDRPFQVLIGREGISLLRWINNRAQMNALMLNVRSAVVQAYNIPNATSLIPSPEAWAKGAALKAKTVTDSGLADIIAKSDFLAQRYMGSASQFDEGVLASAKKFGGWALEAVDKQATELIWWTAYSDFQNGKALGVREYSNAIEYADDIARRSVAGRGVGEVPLALQSQFVRLIAPFQIEVNNQYQNLKQVVGRVLGKGVPIETRKKAALGLVAFGITTYLMNLLSKALFGDGVGGFDYIGATIDALKTLDDDDEDTILQKYLGETISGYPLASLLAQLIGEENSKAFFGEDADPTRYGTGNMGIKAVADLVRVLVSGGDAWDIAKSASNILLPMGGRQAYRTAEGIATVAQGGSYTQDKEGNDLLQFRTDQGALDYLQAGLFGKWSLKEGQDYLNGLPALSARDTQAYKDATSNGIEGKDFLLIRDKLKSFKKTDDQDAVEQKRQYIMNNKALTIEQKTMLDKGLISSNEKTADYSSKAWFELSVIELSNPQTQVYQKAKDAQRQDISPEKYLQYYNRTRGLKSTEDTSVKEQHITIMNGLNMTQEQKDYLLEQRGWKAEE